MPWVRLEDSFADHPKIERVGPLAAWLHVAALCYCARHLTDGRLPMSKALRLADVADPENHVDALLRVGLWHSDGDDYVIHDYLDYQPARVDVEAERLAARDRMAKRRQQKRSPEVPANNRRSSSSPSRPDPRESSSSSSSGYSTGNGAQAADDELSTGGVPDETWEHYAQFKLDRQPSGRVSNPGPYRTATAVNARIELGEQAQRWWEMFDVRPYDLAGWLIDGKPGPYAKPREEVSE